MTQMACMIPVEGLHDNSRRRKREDIIVRLAGCMTNMEGMEWMTGTALHKRQIQIKLIGYPEENQAPTPRQG